jgi:NTE family protein
MRAAMADDKLGLVMTGGGARGAYQAGVLKRIGELKRVRTNGNPFPIIGAASAGAINGAALAAGSDDIASATVQIARLWASLRPNQVFRCDVFSQAANSVAWILDLSFGAILGGGSAHSLLDARPLRRFLSAHLDCSRIESNIKKGNIYALVVPTTNYASGKSYLFIQGRKGHAMWNRSRRVTIATPITVDHICASAAIPLVFQSVKLKTAEGTAFFGDGCVRLHQPLSPVIRLGASRILAIGVRGENLEQQSEPNGKNDPSIAQVVGVLLNAMFLDHLSTDVEHLERINQLLAAGDLGHVGFEDREPMRPLTSLLIAPSVNLSEVAQQHQKDMPYLIQYFVGSLGRDMASCSDLMSCLLFTSKYTSALIDIGYGDAGKRIDEIEQFLYSPPQ